MQNFDDPDWRRPLHYLRYVSTPLGPSDAKTEKDQKRMMGEIGKLLGENDRSWT